MAYQIVGRVLLSIALYPYMGQTMTWARRGSISLMPWVRWGRLRFVLHKRSLGIVEAQVHLMSLELGRLAINCVLCSKNRKKKFN